MFGLIPFKTNGANGKEVTFSDLINDFFNDDFFAPMIMETKSFNTDVRETENEYLVSAELPGVKKEDISLDFKDNYLIISAKRDEIHDESKDNYVRKERCYGSFNRKLYFDNVMKDKICAKFENGELKVILPKEVNNINKGSRIFIQ